MLTFPNFLNNVDTSLYLLFYYFHPLQMQFLLDPECAVQGHYRKETVVVLIIEKFFDLHY